MKNQISVVNKTINKEIQIDGSKSIANRVLIIAAMAKGTSIISNLPNSADVLACINALKELGLKLKHSQKEKTLIIKGGNGEFLNKNAKIFCNESGTLTRFITPMCSVQKDGSYYIYATDRMMERPMSEQLISLEKLGMTAEYENKKYSLPLTIKASSISKSLTEIDGSKSSQFASGLLMAGAYMENGLEIKSITDHKQPYLEMTAKVMKEFDVDVNINKNNYIVKNQSYQAKEYIVEPDASTASYFFAYAVVTGSTIKVKNLNTNSKQGDINFLKALEKMGIKVVYENDGITVIGADKPKGITINMRNFSDTFMTLSAIACFADGDTYISGLKHTRGQESDRISAMEEGLKKLGVYVETTEDSILISPSRSNIKSGEVKSHNDHRIAMSLALLGLKYENIIISGSEAVNKTCPDYFERMANLSK